MSIVPLIFVAGVILVSAGVALALRDLVHSALLLVVTWFGVAAFYLWAGAEFVALAQALVYVGAISMVVLFAVALTRVDETGGSMEGPAPSGPGSRRYARANLRRAGVSVRGASPGPDGAGPSRKVGTGMGLVIAGGVCAVMMGAVWAEAKGGGVLERHVSAGPAPEFSVKQIGAALAGPHAVALVVVGILLTVSLLGAMLIAAPAPQTTKGAKL